MLKATGIHMPLDAEAACRGGEAITEGPLIEAAAQALGIPSGEISAVQVLRRSVDARRKSQVHFVVNAAVELANAEREADLIARGVAAYKPYEPLKIPLVNTAQHEGETSRPVVVGTGPAGLFAALYLARAGMRPIVVERGGNVVERAASVAHFNETGQLNTNSNIQFGEGGAGTFSDGKLTTNTNNQYTAHVLHWFAEAGAPQEILWDAQPHIGSDRLPAVVVAMRNEVIERGGDVLFNTQLSDLRFEGGKLCEIELVETLPLDEDIPGTNQAGARNGASESRWIPCSQLVLACGHSARDTFELLQEHGLHLEQKPFSVGVRIEHPQALVNQAQWGSAAEHTALGAASYKLAAHGLAGRGVYTFCMCPGGEVVCAASEEGRITTNGMSPFARDGKFANAAVLVGVGPEDFASTDPLAGVRFQQEIEQRAYQVARAAGGEAYQVPAQTVGSFLGHNSTAADLPETSCARGTVFCDFREILPAFVCDAICEALPLFDRKLAGFANSEAMLLGPETRSSSPVRVARNDNCQAWLEAMDGNAAASATPREEGCGIYPVGEGAGYAGGIMSAACDGLRVAAALVSECTKAE